MAMQIRVHTSREELYHLRDEWNALLHQSASATVFMTWEWQHVWWEHFGSQSEGSLTLITVRDGNEELIGLWPLYDPTPGQSSRCLRVIGSPRGSDYLDVIARSGQERAVHDAILGFLAKWDGWSTIEVDNIRSGSPTIETMAPMAENLGLEARIEPLAVCPGITLPERWETYLEQLGRKQRHEVRRKLRRAEEGMEQVRWYLSTDPETLGRDMQVYFDLFQKSSYVKEEYLVDRRQSFLRQMASVMLEAGWLYLAFLSVDGEKVASMLCFDYGDAISVYNSGFDPQRFHHLSPGIVLLCRCIQDAIGRGYSFFDFLRGDEEYKYRFGAIDRTIHRLTLRRA